MADPYNGQVLHRLRCDGSVIPKRGVMKKRFLFIGSSFLIPALLWAQARPVISPSVSADRAALVTLDFQNVDLPVLVKFISEMSGRNFVIDERVRGKITLFSPTPVPADRAYAMFVAILEMKGFIIGTTGDLHYILPIAESPPKDRTIRLHPLANISAEEAAKILLGLTSGKPPGLMQKDRTGEISGPVQVLSDKTTNTLIITASDDDYAIFKTILEGLDTRRKQVYVEAVVLEMGIDKFKEVGTDLGAVFSLSDNEVGALGGLNQGVAELPTLAELTKKLNLPIHPLNIRAFLRALQNASDVNILSTPQILAADNQKAEIVVAQNVPFPGAQSQTSGGNVQTTIERKDVGVTLRLTPTVLGGNLVKMEVYQEVSSVLESVQSVGNTVLGPTTSKRAATTTVIVPHARTVAIGGLIRDNVIAAERKIPLLGDLPFLGWLFKTRTHRIEKTNLMVFLTPYVVEGDEDIERLRADRTERMADFIRNNPVAGGQKRKEWLEQQITLPK